MELQQQIVIVFKVKVELKKKGECRKALKVNDNLAFNTERNEI